MILPKNHGWLLLEPAAIVGYLQRQSPFWVADRYHGALKELTN